MELRITPYWKQLGKDCQCWQLGNTQAARLTVIGTQDIGTLLAADKIQHESVFSAFLQNYTQNPLSKYFLVSRIINPSKSDYKYQGKDTRHSTVLALVKITKISDVEEEIWINN